MSLHVSSSLSTVYKGNKGDRDINGASDLFPLCTVRFAYINLVVIVNVSLLGFPPEH